MTTIIEVIKRLGAFLGLRFSGKLEKFEGSEDKLVLVYGYGSKDTKVMDFFRNW